MTQVPPSGAQSQHAVHPRPGSSLPVAALILGLCGIVPFLGVLAGLTGVILGIVSLAKGAGRNGMAVTGIITGLVLPTIGTATLMVAVLVPALGHAREVAKRALCGSHLNCIGKGMVMYGAENGDAYPPDLDLLVESGMVTPKMLQCPSTDGSRKVDYFYLPPAQPNASAKTLVACDLAGNHKDGRNVLYAAGNVKWRSEQVFQAELANPLNAAFAAALRKIEGP